MVYVLIDFAIKTTEFYNNDNLKKPVFPCEIFSERVLKIFPYVIVKHLTRVLEITT